MRVTETLLACPDYGDYISSGLVLLLELFDADDCLWLDLDLTPGNDGTSAPAAPDGFTPALLSDQPGVVEAGHRLSLVVALTPRSRGRGWVLVRASPGFSDPQRDLAHALLPVLMVLDRMHRPGPLPRQRLHLDTSAARVRWRLTAREAEVLGHLGQGLTAEAMARVLGISPRTVRKHLERLYDKSGMHDRLIVVQHARRLNEAPTQ